MPSNVADYSYITSFLWPNFITIDNSFSLLLFSLFCQLTTLVNGRDLKDKRYLMLLNGDLLVDAGPLAHVKARYMNDPLNEELTNCKFVVKELEGAIVSTRLIKAGEELFVSYGDAYWSQHKSVARQLRC
jgi:hypothetical protein